MIWPGRQQSFTSISYIQTVETPAHASLEEAEYVQLADNCYEINPDKAPQDPEGAHSAATSHATLS